MSTKTPAKKAVAPSYEVTASIMGRTYIAKGKSVAEALARMTTGNSKGKCVLSVKKGTVTKIRVLMPALSYRLFSGAGLTKEIAIKNVALMFDGI